MGVRKNSATPLEVPNTTLIPRADGWLLTATPLKTEN